MNVQKQPEQKPDDIPVARFSMRTPEMLIGNPEKSPYPEVHTEQEYARDTTTWD